MIFQSRLGDPLFIQGKLVGTLVKKSTSDFPIYYYCTFQDSENLFDHKRILYGEK